MKTFDLDPPIQGDELYLIDRLSVHWLQSKGYDWRYLGEKRLSRAYRVIIEKQSPRQVAADDGVVKQRVYEAVNKALRAVKKLRAQNEKTN